MTDKIDFELSADDVAEPRTTTKPKTIKQRLRALFSRAVDKTKTLANTASERRSVQLATQFGKAAGRSAIRFSTVAGANMLISHIAPESWSMITPYIVPATMCAYNSIKDIRANSAARRAYHQRRGTSGGYRHRSDLRYALDHPFKSAGIIAKNAILPTIAGIIGWEAGQDLSFGDSAGAVTDSTPPAQTPDSGAQTPSPSSSDALTEPSAPTEDVPGTDTLETQAETPAADTDPQSDAPIPEAPLERLEMLVDMNPEWEQDDTIQAALRGEKWAIRDAGLMIFNEGWHGSALPDIDAPFDLKTLGADMVQSIAEQGDTNAQANFAFMQRWGLGTQQNIQNAVDTIKQLGKSWGGASMRDILSLG